MKIKHVSLAVLATLGVASQAYAYDCNAVTFSQPYVECQGSFAPPPNDSVTSVNALTWSTGFTAVAGTKDDTVDGSGSTSTLIDASAAGNGAGSVTFLSAVTDPFVLVVKLGQEWAGYLFDTDVAAGTTWTFSGGPATGGGLSHASVYTGNTVPAVPEPETYALMLAGLGLVGMVARRRRA